VRQHGSAPIIGAEREAIARGAAFRVQRTPHASAAITGVDLRSLAPEISAEDVCALTGAPGPARRTHGNAHDPSVLVQ